VDPYHHSRTRAATPEETDELHSLVLAATKPKPL
jgi:hypothetical protein